MLNWLSLCGLFLTIVPFPSAQAAEPLPKLTNEDYAEVLARAPHVGAQFLIMDMADGAPVDRQYFKSKFGVSEAAKIPKMTLEGGFIRFEGVAKKFDLSDVGNGRIYDGYRYFQFDPRHFSEKSFESLVAYLTAKERSAIDWSEPVANADTADGLETSESQENFTRGTAVAIGVLGAARILPLAAEAIAGTASGAGLLTAGAVVGGALVLAEAAESTYKGFKRFFKGDQIVCINGELFLKKLSGETTLLTPNGENALKKYFGQSEIGASELLARKMFCQKPANLIQLNSVLSRSAGMGEVKTPTLPDVDSGSPK